MRIGAISDLHIDRHPKLKSNVYLETLIKVVQHREVDLLLIAGDISNYFRDSYQFIKDLKTALHIPVLFVPGNHDYWKVEDETTSQDIYDFYRTKPECLLDHPYVINDNWAIVGHTAWYDYSYADKKFEETRLKKGKYYGATWQDKVKIDWDEDDTILSKKAAKHVKQALEQLQDKQIILMTHIVTHSKFVVPTPHRIFDFFNAFIGTSDFNQLYQQFPIKYSIMGHVHFRKSLVENNITFLCPCLGYKREWRTADIYSEMNHALMDFVIK